MKLSKSICKVLAQGTGAALSIKLLYDFSLFKNQVAVCSEVALNNEQLVNLVIITRHGARTPLTIIDGIEQAEYTPRMLEPLVQAKYRLVTLDGADFPDKISRNDERNLKKKLKGGAGRGQLTMYGEQQLFELGRQLRNKYVHDLKFLSSEYDSNEIYTRSSHIKRTVNSAKSLLAGLYLKSTLDDTNNSFVIHTNDADTDYLFPNIGNCEYLKEFYKPARLKEMQALQRDEGYVKFLKSLEQEISTGYKLAASPLASILFFDDLQVRLAHNKLVPGNLKSLLKNSNYYSTMEMKRDMTPKLNLFFGQFFNLIKNNLVKSIKYDLNNETSHKCHYYSAHDTTINGILLGLGLVDENHEWPPFAANIIIELWKTTGDSSQTNEESNYFIRFYYCGKLMSFQGTDCDGEKYNLKNFIQLLEKHSIDKSTYDELCLMKVDD